MQAFSRNAANKMPLIEAAGRVRVLAPWTKP